MTNDKPREPFNEYGINTIQELVANSFELLLEVILTVEHSLALKMASFLS